MPKIDQSVDFTDPFIIMRWNWQMAEKWGLRLRGDIGGFGIGSDLTWNLVGLVKFKPWKHVALVGGYRALYQNFSQGNGKNKFEFDATLHGPVLGLNITKTKFASLLWALVCQRLDEARPPPAGWLSWATEISSCSISVPRPIIVHEFD